MFGTVLDELNNDWTKGMEFLIKDVLANADSDEAYDLAKKFKTQHMRNRSITFIEPKMIDQLKMFRDQFNFIDDMSLYEVEYMFLKASRNCVLKDGVKDLLRYLSDYNNDLYIMSNTIYSAITIKRFIKDFGLMDYFKDVFTSSDYGYRKPSNRFFEHVIDQATNGLNHLAEDIVFIGNSFEKDVLGGMSSGMHTIWLCENQETQDSSFEGYVRKSTMTEIKKYFANNFIYMSSIADDYSVTDGIGNRLVVYFQGCNRHCEGCHNQITWDITSGRRKHVKTIAIEILKRLNRYSKNITISGGEPLLQRKPLIKLIEILNKYNINICLYTGNDFEEVPERIKDKVDYIKSGSFDIEKKDSTKGFYGSYNQSLWKKGENEIWKKINLA